MQHFFHGFKTVLDLIGSGWFFLSPVLETRAAFAGLNLAPDGCVPDDQQCKFLLDVMLGRHQKLRSMFTMLMSSVSKFGSITGGFNQKKLFHRI